MTAREQPKQIMFHFSSLTPADNMLWNDFQNAYLALWKLTLQAEYCASEARRQLSCGCVFILKNKQGEGGRLQSRFFVPPEYSMDNRLKGKIYQTAHWRTLM